MARQLFAEVFEFDQVEICVNYTKAEVIAKLYDLRIESEQFERDQDLKTVLALAIAWIQLIDYLQVICESQ